MLQAVHASLHVPTLPCSGLLPWGSHGGLPAEWAHASAVTQIRALSGNNAGIPDLVGDLHNLTTLHLFDCDFSSASGQSIPSNLGGLTNLKLFRVEAANMVGTVPLELGLIEGLSELRFPRNQLSGLFCSHALDASVPFAHSHRASFTSYARSTACTPGWVRVETADLPSAARHRTASIVLRAWLGCAHHLTAQSDPSRAWRSPSVHRRRSTAGRAGDAGEAHAAPGLVGERADRHHPCALPGEPAAGGAAPQRQPPDGIDPVTERLHATGTPLAL
jgi:hypothetical protein